MAIHAVRRRLQGPPSQFPLGLYLALHFGSGLGFPMFGWVAHYFFCDSCWYHCYSSHCSRWSDRADLTMDQCHTVIHSIFSGVAVVADSAWQKKMSRKWDITTATMMESSPELLTLLVLSHKDKLRRARRLIQLLYYYDPLCTRELDNVNKYILQVKRSLFSVVASITQNP